MKKILAMTLVLTLLFTLVACGGGSSPSTAEASNTASTASSTTAAASESPAASSDEVITVSMGTVLAEDNPYQIGCYYFQKRVDELIPGRIVWENYINSVLGSERDMGEAMFSGAINGMINGNGSVSDFTSITKNSFADVPFLLSHYDQMFAVLDSEAGKIMTQDYYDNGITVVGYLVVGPSEIENNVRPIYTPEDLKGMKIRSYQSEGPFMFLEACGALPVNITVGEVYTSLQQGAIDGVFSNSFAFKPFKFTEVTSYHSALNVLNPYQTIGFENKWFESLPQDVQDAFMQAGADTQQYCKDTLAPLSAQNTYADIESDGVEVNYLTDEQWQVFQDLMKEKVWPDFKERIGDEMWNLILDVAGIEE